MFDMADYEADNYMNDPYYSEDEYDIEDTCKYGVIGSRNTEICNTPMGPRLAAYIRDIEAQYGGAANSEEDNNNNNNEEATTYTIRSNPINVNVTTGETHYLPAT